MCMDAIHNSALLHQQNTKQWPAQKLSPEQKQRLAVEALAGTETITHLAQESLVSRRFVYRQVDKAQQALHKTFCPCQTASSEALFWLPVSEEWLQQLTLSLALICHSSERGIVELLRDLFDCRISLGKVHGILHQATQRARAYNAGQDLSRVRIGAHDEIFQSGQPVLVGADVASTYCYLLSGEESRDADTWAIRLMELQDQGFAPDATIADFGPALRAGQSEACPDVPCRGDLFHLVQDLQELVTYLDNRAYEAIAERTHLEYEQARFQYRHGHPNATCSQKRRYACATEKQAVALADEVRLLVDWLRQEVLAVAGPAIPIRRLLYDFIVAELQARAPLCRHRFAPVLRLLKKQRDALLAFAEQLDCELARIAREWAIPEDWTRELLQVQALDPRLPQRWQRDAVLHQKLGARYYSVSQDIECLVQRTVRASSIVENLNSRLRSYFFLRRHLGPDYLALLQFFLNHRRFMRSQHRDRVGRSPAELMTGTQHPHWLEMLGYQLFSRN